MAQFTAVNGVNRVYCPWCGWHTTIVATALAPGANGLPHRCSNTRCKRPYVVVLRADYAERAVEVMAVRKLVREDVVAYRAALVSIAVLNEDEREFMLASYQLLGQTWMMAVA